MILFGLATLLSMVVADLQTVSDVPVVPGTKLKLVIRDIDGGMEPIFDMKNLSSHKSP